MSLLLGLTEEHQIQEGNYFIGWSNKHLKLTQFQLNYSWQLMASGFSCICNVVFGVHRIPRVEKFFDRVNHDILMSQLSKRVRDKRLLKIIRRYLNAGMMKEGVCIR